MTITAQNRQEIRNILNTKIDAQPDYHSDSYAEMCAPYPFRYYSYHRPVGGWLRVGQTDIVTVDELGGRRHGFVYTKAPIDTEKLLSLDLYPMEGDAWDALYTLLRDYENQRVAERRSRPLPMNGTDYHVFGEE